MAKSLPPVSTKLIADAENFIKEFRRAERAAQASTGRIGAEVDKMAKTLSKKFSMGDIGKSVLSGFGLGSGFAVAQQAADVLVGQFERAARAAENVEAATAATFNALDQQLRKRRTDEQELNKLLNDQARITREIENLRKPKTVEITRRDREGFSVTNKVKLPVSDDDNLKIHNMVTELQVLGGTIDELKRKLAKDKPLWENGSSLGLFNASSAIEAEALNIQLQEMVTNVSDLTRQAKMSDSFLFDPKAIHAAAVEQDRLTQIAKEHVAVWSDFFEAGGFGGPAGIAQVMASNAEAAEEMKDSVVYFADGIGSFFDDAIARGKDLGDLVEDLGSSIASTFLKLSVVNPIMNKIFGKASGWDVLPTLFGFADGGRPPVGRPSVVGERGPELFVPDSAGTIVPNHKLGGGGGGGTYYIDARGADRTGLARLEAMIRALHGSVEQRAVAAVADFRRRGAFA